MNDVITQIIAVYGAILSTASLLWIIYTWRREKAIRIEFSSRFAELIQLEGETITDAEKRGPTWILTAKNTGPNPIIISRVGIILENGSRAEFLRYQNNKVLLPGEQTNWLIPINSQVVIPTGPGPYGWTKSTLKVFADVREKTRYFYLQRHDGKIYKTPLP